MDFSPFWGLSLQGNRAKGMPFAATSCFLYIVYEYGMLLDSHTLCSEAGFAYSLYSNAVNRVIGIHIAALETQPPLAGLCNPE
jgi:hypothetical protein